MIQRPLCLSCKKYFGLRKGTPNCKANLQGIPREIIFQANSCPTYAEKAGGGNIMNDEGTLGKQEQKERLIELRAAGHSFEAIAKTLGISKPTLISWSRGLSRGGPSIRVA